MGENSEGEGTEDSIFRRPTPVHTENARDREPGILTYDDREYLLDQKDVTGGSEIQLRQRLRDRIRNGLLDFELLLYCLDDQDVQTIFSNISGPFRTIGTDGREVHDGAKYTLAFLYFGITEFSQVDFEELLEAAIESSGRRSSERRRGPHQWVADASVDIDVDWEIRAWDNDQIVEKLRSGEPMTDRELGLLVRFGDLDDEDWERLQNEIAEGPPSESEISQE